MLTAEWTFLNQPERLAELNQRYRRLTPIAPSSCSQHRRHSAAPGRRRRPSRGPPSAAAAAGDAAPACAQAGAPVARHGRPRRSPAPSCRRRPRPAPGAARQLARRAVRAGRRGRLMLSPSASTTIPCRPRHFKPPPCAPGGRRRRPAQQLLETGRTRLLVAAALFACVFLVVGAAPGRRRRCSRRRRRAARRARAASPRRRRRPRRHRRPQRRAARDDARQPVALRQSEADPRRRDERGARSSPAVLPDLDRRRDLRQARLGQELRLAEAAADAAPGIRRSTASAFPASAIPAPRSAASIPHGDLAAHVVGYCDIDNNGLAGIERGFDAALHEQRRAGRSCRSTRAAVHPARRAAARSIDEFNAKGGAGIIMDVQHRRDPRDGLAAGFRPEPPAVDRPEPRRRDKTIFNRVTLGVYEMGSVFKIFNTAMALDSGIATMTSSYDATQPDQDRPLHDPRLSRQAPLAERAGDLHVFVEYRLGADGDRGRRRAAARLPRPARPAERRCRSSSPEVGAPHVPAPVARDQHHDHRLRPRHLGEPAADGRRRSAPIVNGGILHRRRCSSVPAGYDPRRAQRVISAKTSEQMRKLMRLVVEHGTGKLAEAPGYLVGGKTGTAEKVVGTATTTTRSCSRPSSACSR